MEPIVWKYELSRMKDVYREVLASLGYYFNLEVDPYNVEIKRGLNSIYAYGDEPKDLKLLKEHKLDINEVMGAGYGTIFYGVHDETIYFDSLTRLVVKFNKYLELTVCYSHGQKTFMIKSTKNEEIKEQNGNYNLVTITFDDQAKNFNNIRIKTIKVEKKNKPVIVEGSIEQYENDADFYTIGQMPKEIPLTPPDVDKYLGIITNYVKGGEYYRPKDIMKTLTLITPALRLCAKDFINQRITYWTNRRDNQQRHVYELDEVRKKKIEEINKEYDRRKAEAQKLADSYNDKVIRFEEDKRRQR